MARILVSGLINIETTLRIDQFPLAYNPVNYPFGGVASTISGVGLNVARALQVLGHEVNLVSMIGSDPASRWVRDQLHRWKLSDHYVLETMDSTPQSVILYDKDGRRQIHVDLKRIQETAYPANHVENIMPECDLAVLCNINYNRGLIKSATNYDLAIATDVHALSDCCDEYNRDFMAAAKILFLSHEHLPDEPHAFAQKLKSLYQNNVIVVGMGNHGALLQTDNDMPPIQISAVSTRPVVNTIGAGDALFSSFLHGWVNQLEPEQALRQAMIFASWKIGCASASEGFLTAAELKML